MGGKGDGTGSGGSRKRQRVSAGGSCSDTSCFGQMIGSSSHCSSAWPGMAPHEHEDLDDDGSLDGKGLGNDAEARAPPGVILFGDEATADVVLHLLEGGASEGDEEGHHVMYLHSKALSKSRYFAALLSERWRDVGSDENGAADGIEQKQMHVRISTPSQSVGAYITTLRLFYTENFSEAIVNVQSALSILPVAAELLYDECIATCLRFLEAVPWTNDEEKQIVQLVSYLQLEEGPNILARLVSARETAVEDMLNELVYAATHAHQNAACVKVFVGKVLSSHSSRETVRLVLDNAFKNGLKTVKDSVEEYSSPNVRGGRNDEIEAIQRQNLHTAVVSGRHLLWLVERMIELKVAEYAVLEWSEQSAFTANLKRAFMDDVWRNNVPGLPAVLLRCTCRLGNAMVSGSILVSRDVRKKMVRDWLPVLITSKENAVSANCNKQLHLELEEVFLKLILTLPVSDAQELLQLCLSFASRSHDESSQLAKAFNTWFRRASQPNPLVPQSATRSSE